MIHKGEHQAIVPLDLWNRVHAMLQVSPRTKANQNRSQTPALLRGLSELDRVHLVLELQKTTNRSLLAQKEAYVDDLVKQVLLKPNSQHAKLTRCGGGGG